MVSKIIITGIIFVILSGGITFPYVSAAVSTSINVFSDLKSIHEGREITFQGQITHRLDGGIPKGVPNTSFTLIETVSGQTLTTGSTTDEGIFKVKITMKNFNGNNDQIIKAIHTGSGNYERSESSPIEIYVYSSDALIASQERSNAEIAKSEAEREKAQAEIAKSEAEREKAQAEIAKSEAEREKAQAEIAKSEVQDVIKDAEIAKSEVQQAIKDAETTREDVLKNNNAEVVISVPFANSDPDDESIMKSEYLIGLIVIPIIVVGIILAKRKSPPKVNKKRETLPDLGGSRGWYCKNENCDNYGHDIFPDSNGVRKCKTCGWSPQS